MKEQVNVFEEVAESGVDLSSDARGAYKVLKQAIKSMGLVCDVPAPVLLESVEQFGKDIFEGLKAVTCHRPSNIHWIVELKFRAQPA